MPEPTDREFRVRFRHTGEPDSHTYPPTPAEAGRAYREKRDEIARSGRGGEAAIEERRVGPWQAAGEVAVIPAAGEGG